MTVSIGGKFFDIGRHGYWWNSTGTNAGYTYSLGWSFSFSSGDVSRHDEYNKKFGFSVRCIKDN
jgi:uncharacterized protein (TIGR02145 family)